MNPERKIAAVIVIVLNVKCFTDLKYCLIHMFVFSV